MNPTRSTISSSFGSALDPASLFWAASSLPDVALDAGGAFVLTFGVTQLDAMARAAADRVATPNCATLLASRSDKGFSSVTSPPESLR